MNLGKLFVIATPIGNLGDISFRSLRTLKEADLILCEDTRQTKILCDYYQIKTPLLSYHQHSKTKKIEKIFKLIREGKDIALVSDAGTPGISDPGNKLINLLIKEFKNLIIIPLPGPSATMVALSVSGFPTDRFIFLGFCPGKKGRNKFFQEILKGEYSIVFFESPYRILKTLTDLDNFSKLKNRQIFLGRELTKKFETIYRGNIREVIDFLKKDKIKGEFTIVVSPEKNE
ncbi:MAG: 16S rRNA (cytidine(1402)-2'-O)-methyltransferase [Patescibacteria group bacterium]|jgi:16S rRNA (cytidine1402-2'-O)-methyltransferase|nr:16S rRNA (cytidine(1402)-2'-O)-methyltransferase [Patescibacteria group bacterium]MDD5172536.1 16S rRNA (cytidine(1402)-2'-O)-methyltransferase [Patescibacteria group bacterium]